ncbi:Fructose-bisphosphate aldolase class 2 [Desulfurella amilsii]|uniref:Fructose-bisphosphate aldolase class 2 n=1 Tax=Desulfurella amilsii TaxID=1562698 RepID=A0A1X4XXX3_9BACT|nr:Fructose-bisphosphate aldolase class 2 [Desulfurella amilsii]
MKKIHYSALGFVNTNGSHLPYEENIALTKQVVDYARGFDVSVEGELGVLAGIEEEISSNKHIYTNPDDVEDFVQKNRC